MMLKRSILWIAPLLAVALCSAGCSGGDAPSAAAEPVATAVPEAVPVTVAPVASRPTKRLLKFVGTLFGNEEVKLSSQVEGQIRAIHVDLGDPVTAEQVLLEVEDDNLRARLRELDATLAKVRADEARGRQLVADKVISPQEYETMQTAVAVSEAQRDTLDVMRHHTRVRSPLSGSVARRLVSAGEYVRPGTPLFDLVAEHPLKLRGEVPERFAQELAIGQPVQIKVDAYPDVEFVGRLARISPTANAENRSIAVEALVDNPERRLKPGFFANANIVTRADDAAVMVPETAVISFAGVTKLFVVKDDVAAERHVQTGTRDDQGLIEILAGLQAGEVVATSGLAKLENGTRVAIRAAD